MLRCLFGGWIAFVAIGSISFSFLHAQEAERPPEPRESAESTESTPIFDEAQLAMLIQQLDADEFAVRRDASQRLLEAGKTAIPALKKAALGDSREVTTRSLEILQKHFTQGDEAIKAAAKQALQEIAASEQTVARRAKEILNPAPPPQVAQGIRIAPQAIQIRVNAIGGRVARRVQIENGKKQIEVDEDGRKVKISEDANRGIEIEVTDKENGKEVTKKYAAKTVEDLKKNEPEGYKIYEKYQNQGGAIQINGIQLLPQAVPVPGLPQAVPRPIPVPAPVPEVPPQDGADARQQALRRIATVQLRQAESMLKSAASVLKQLPTNDENHQELRAIAERLEKIEQQLREEKAKLAD
jgi:hypothetical protein